MRVERVVPWRRPIAAGDARNVWHERRGVLVVVEHRGMRGIGEASPLPGFAAGGAGAGVAGFGAPGVAGSGASGGEAAAMRFAVETAVLDVLARLRGVSVAELLVSAPAARVAINALVGDEASARAAIARGVMTLKLKVGAEDPGRLRALAAVLPRITWRLDANQRWPLAEVEVRLAALADAAGPSRIEYVEEPATGLGPTLRAPLPLPIALDESLASPERDTWLDAALASGAVAALILKPTVLGGFAACAALARRARAHGVEPIVTHALEGPVGTAACAELARALACERPVGLDHHATLAAWNRSIPQLAGDAIAAAAAPGLGLDVDELLAAAEAR